MAENNITRLLTGWLTEVTTVEDALAQMLEQRDIDTAVAPYLDLLGKVVGQARSGLTDELYRPRIRARIAANRSRGTVEDLIRVTDLVVYDDDASIVVETQPNATVVVRIEDIAITADTATATLDLLQDAVVAGVRIILEYSTEPPADVGRWSSQGLWGTADWAAGDD